MENSLLKVQDVSKVYRLGMIGGTTLREDLLRLKAKILKQDDPTRKIGEKEIDPALVGSRFKALDHISFEVKRGEAVGIIGHNGAGKSTLLKLITRITAPTEGWIGLNGRITSMLEVGTGFHPELTGRENIYMNGAILGMTRKEIDEKIDEIIEFSEVSKFIDTPVKRYSSGMYVKLAFSVAAHLDSEIIIMDEVLAVGDMAFQKKCLDKMRDAATREGRTILYVSHNMNTIRQLCDRCIVLDHGQIIFDGDVEEGIGKYMSSSREMALVNDCSGPHTGYQTDNKIHIDRISFLNKEIPVYSSDPNVIVRVDYTANEKLKDFAFRMTVSSVDKTVVGLATTKASITSKIGQNSLEMILNISNLAPGQYVIKLSAYSVNGYGADQLHDVVDDSCKFEKIQLLDDNIKMAWNHNWWGYMVFPELEIGE